MNEYANEKGLKDAMAGTLKLSKDGVSVEILNENKLRSTLIDELVWNAVFSPDENVRNLTRTVIRLAAKKYGLGPASIYDVYAARGEGKFSGVTVPAINIRGLTYETARAVFRAANKSDAGLIIIEIARSEIGYTEQRPSEYTAVVLGAAIKEGYKYPVFLQGDHYQVNGKKYKESPEKEMQGARDIIKESIEAGFYNIDIDTSTLVDLSKSTIREQQELNYRIASDVTKLIREIEPKGITVALGGEIGEIGGKNSTEDELRAYLDGYFEMTRGLKGITKVAVQTGTTHGGIPLPDGQIAKVKLDFDTLERLGKVAQKEYKLAGCVQHGASTLPPELFDRFPKVETAEIHLATEFQNMVFDNPSFPADLKTQINAHLLKENASEKKETDTEQQFLYKTRKKAFGPFKKQIWSLPAPILKIISAGLEEKFSSLFEKLGVRNSGGIVKKYTKTVDAPVEISKTATDEIFEGAD
ncbi:MAG: class II fructose-bisphosphate aldolase [Elusimicrobia bacterium]|nr:class II fructose-bisphosphate aldolase [Elusimicrobiota bacterium]